LNSWGNTNPSISNTGLTALGENLAKLSDLKELDLNLYWYLNQLIDLSIHRIFVK